MNDRAVIRSFEGAFDKRKVAIVFVVLLAAAIVIGVVARGFHGRRVSQGADALSRPPAVPTQPRRAP